MCDAPVQHRSDRRAGATLRCRWLSLQRRLIFVECKRAGPFLNFDDQSIATVSAQQCDTR